LVFEHENDYELSAQKIDFFKLCLYVADLRVFVGYTPQRDGENGACSRANELTEFYRTHDYRQIAGAETLIMLTNWYDFAHDMQWEVRLLQNQDGIWRRLSPITGAQS
jgi:hypothetical protein